MTLHRWGRDERNLRWEQRATLIATLSLDQTYFGEPDGLLIVETNGRSRAEGGAPMIMIQSRDLRVGDVVDYHGEFHTVAHVDREVGWSWPVAFDDAGWAIAVGDDLVCVDRAARTPGAAGRRSARGRAPALVAQHAI